MAKTLGALIASIALQAGCSMLPNQSSPVLSQQKTSPKASSNEARDAIQLDETLDAIVSLVKELITNDASFATFAENPSLYVATNTTLSKVFPENYNYSEFISTISAAKRAYGNSKGNLSYFNEILQVRGTTTDQFRARGRTLEWSHQVKTQTSFDPAVETKLGRESGIEFNRNAIANQAFPQNTTTTYDSGMNLNIEGKDFGPLISPTIMSQLTKSY